VAGINVSKADVYAVVLDDIGINVSKAKVYAVVFSGLLAIPGTAHLALTRYAPTVSIKTPVVTITARPATASLSITPIAPTIHATANYTAYAQPAHISISTYTPLAYIVEPAIPPTHSIYAPGAAPGAGDIYRLDQDPGGTDIYRSGQSGIYKKR